jgi:hypothetical protein
MTSHLIHRDPPCHWIQPRAYQDASARYRKHGPIQPMEYPREPIWRRIFGGRP